MIFQGSFLRGSMILFFISFFLVFVSSYFLTSIIAPKKNVLGLIYLFLIAFAQIVLTFEVLSLFSAIKPFQALGLNILFLIFSTSFWFKRSKPLWSLDLSDFKNKIFNSFKLDKSLIWLFVGFCIFIFVSLVLCFVSPISSADASHYHLARSLFWVLQGSLNHFETADIRNLCFPINSEILYSWILLFAKKDVFLGFFSFVGYVLSVVSIYSTLGLMGFCTRKKLWAIFILSSFSSVIVQVSGTETDVIVAGLITSSIFLYWHALKYDQKMPIFMSSLAYALAIGTKTPAVMAIPGVGLLFLFLSIKFRAKEFYKPLLLFLGFGLLNFIIFASYNYVLNFIHFQNPVSSKVLLMTTKNYYGVKAIPASFIKYIFLFFDFTGFRWSDYVGQYFTDFKNILLNFLHLSYIKDGLYSMDTGPNRTLLEPVMGAGILGFLVFLPCWFWSLIRPLFKPKSKKGILLFIFGLILVINISLMSYLIVFMIYSIRFLATFIIISAPVLVFSYFKRKNVFKFVIVVFALFYLILVSTHLWARPFIKMSKLFYKHPSISYLREAFKCRGENDFNAYSNATCVLRDVIKNKISEENKILALFSSSQDIFTIKRLEFSGYKIDFARAENIKNIDLKKYNIIIIDFNDIKATNITEYEKRKDETKIENNKIITKEGNIFPCIYNFNETLPKSLLNDKEKIYPYVSQCIISKEFIKENKLYILYKVARPLSENRFEGFIMLKNQNNPLILHNNFKK